MKIPQHRGQCVRPNAPRQAARLNAGKRKSVSISSRAI